MAADFYLTNVGRQFWHVADTPLRLIIGRNQADNDALMRLAGERDLLFKTRDFPGPIALGRFMGVEWSAEAVQGAAAFVASYSPKAVRHAEGGGITPVRVHPGSLDAPGSVVEAQPSRNPDFAWNEYAWEDAKREIKAEMKAGTEASRPEAGSV